MNSIELKKHIVSGGIDTLLIELYGERSLCEARIRYSDAIDCYCARFGQCDELIICSAPGRAEIGGNHTDHNHGQVLAAAIDKDIIVVASRTNEEVITVKSEGFPENSVSLSSLSPNKSEFERSEALIRGIADGFYKRGYKIGGFNAYSTSQVPKGSGISSSAAFEVALGTVFNHLYNRGEVSPREIALIGQYAENEFFNKPSGLMDQTASAAGGFVAIDFKDPASPEIKSIPNNFKHFAHTLCVVNTGGSHDNLTEQFASIPREMKAVAGMLGAETLRSISKKEIFDNADIIRKACGDRAFLRALHFFDENQRVLNQVECLEKSDFKDFLHHVNMSGISSLKWLQNTYNIDNFKSQGISIGLYLTESFLNGEGACRVHGGGFAGTILSFIPDARLAEYSSYIDNIFGEHSCVPLRVRGLGCLRVI